jgi:hypothetical protein
MPAFLLMTSFPIAQPVNNTNFFNNNVTTQSAIDLTFIPS